MGPHAHIPYEKISLHRELLNKYEINLEVYISAHILDNVEEREILSFKNSLNYVPELTIHAPFMDLSPGAVDSVIRKVTIERFLKIVDIASKLSVKAVVFHSGYEKWKYGLKIEPWLEGSIRTWREILDRVGDRFLVLIENIFEDEPTNLRLLMEQIHAPNFGLCFDTGHFNLFSRVSLKEWLSQTLPYIKELHLHNNDRTADQHYPVDEGTFNMMELFETIGNRDLIYTIEAHKPEHFLKSLKWLEEFRASGVHS
ncbi:MAG: sugar phosphate isomerase/epimerase [Thermodesulfovibrionales bacterium]|nr:sugar phosphate isomerase/epimerase [Thermodesulfovibrionales bacterium]